jgi:hypothetical protein
VAKNDEERLDSFLNLLFGIDSGAILFFLIVKGTKLGEAQLPFQLAFFPFKPQILMLASCALCILLLRGSNLFWHDKQSFPKLGKWLALILLVVSVIAIAWGGWTLIQNPDLLPDGKK